MFKLKRKKAKSKTAKKKIKKPAKKLKKPVRKKAVKKAVKKKTKKPKIKKKAVKTKKPKAVRKKIAKKPVKKAVRGPVKTLAKKPQLVKKVQPAKPEVSKQIKAGKFHIKVENVVSFAVLGVDIPLEMLVTKLENTEYEPEQFPGLVYRSQSPRAAALIFSSGKIVCTGAKSIENSKAAMKAVAGKIRDLGIKVPYKFPIKIENIVAGSKIDAKLNLEEIAFSLENAEYEPEQFPGLVFRISEPRVAFLLFSSGKMIITGAHSLNDVQRALEKFKVKLEEIGIKVIPIEG